MLDLHILKPEAFGLDISNLSLKIIKLEKKRGRIRVASFGEQKLKKGVIEKGEIKDIKALSSVFRMARNKAQGKKIRTKYVVCSLPEEKAFLQVIQLPKMTQEEAKEAVFFEAENYIPMPAKDTYLDFQIIPCFHNETKNMAVLIAALPKAIVDSYVLALKTAGLIPWILEIESLAIARAVINQDINKKPVLIIDIGADRTNFIIFSGQTINFTSSIPISSELFTEKISKNLKIPFPKAEKLKKRYGLTGIKKIKLMAIKKNGIEFQKRVSRGKEIFEALIPLLTDLTEQIKIHLDYYLSRGLHKDLLPEYQGIEKVLLSGGGANLKGLVEFLEEQLKMPVKMANPWINILPPALKETPELSFETSLRYTTAIGLALRGIKSSG